MRAVIIPQHHGALAAFRTRKQSGAQGEVRQGTEGALEGSTSSSGLRDPGQHRHPAQAERGHDLGLVQGQSAHVRG